jgi:hypothetical protein
MSRKYKVVGLLRKAFLSKIVTKHHAKIKNYLFCITKISIIRAYLLSPS